MNNILLQADLCVVIQGQLLSDKEGLFFLINELIKTLHFRLPFTLKIHLFNNICFIYSFFKSLEYFWQTLYIIYKSMFNMF